MMLRAGHDEEDVVVALPHEVGFVVCNESHGAFAAALFRPYAGERNLWLLEHHAIFQSYHVQEYPACDPHERERWRGHPHFGPTAEFVDRYDQRAIDPRREILPLEAFDPLVRRFFARTPRLCDVT